MSSLQEGAAETIYEAAYSLFTQSPQPDWVTFFREVFGLPGIIRRTFTTPEKLVEFEATNTYNELLAMLTRLRERAQHAGDKCSEPTRVVTVRLPRSVHEVLRLEAHEKNTSMNKLCISKLTQRIDGGLVPKEAWQRVAATEKAKIVPAVEGNS